MNGGLNFLPTEQGKSGQSARGKAGKQESTSPFKGD